MSYLEAIKIALFTFPFLAFLFTSPFILWQYHKYGSVNKLRVLIIYSFILYMICVYFLAIFPLPSIDEIDMSGPICQLIPFGFVLGIVKEIPNMKDIFDVFLNSSVYTVLFNILMFIPFGIYLRYYFKVSLKRIAIFSFIFSLFLEITQLTGLYFIYPHPYRLFDVDDLMINTLGGVLGYFIAGLFIKFLPSRETIDLESLEEGKKVSGLKRITRFCLDVFIYLIFTVILSAIIDIRHVGAISLIIYYVVIPYIFKGQTLGGRFLNMRLVFPNKRLFRLFFRLVLIVLYFLVIPFGVGYIYMFCVRNFELSNILIFVLGAIYVLCLGIFYLVNITNIFKKKLLFYDKVSKGEYVSTIGEENLQKCDENE